MTGANTLGPHLRIGGLLRGAPSFLDRLQTFVDQYEGGGADLAERLDALTARIAALEEWV